MTTRRLWNAQIKTIYEAEQVMLKAEDRDCTECLGQGMIPSSGERRPKGYKPWYTSAATCTGCSGTGRYVDQMKSSRRRRFEMFKIDPGDSPKY